MYAFVLSSKLARSENGPISKDIIEKGIRGIHHNFVVISLCNILFSNIICTGKLMALTCSVLGTFYVIYTQEASVVLMLFFGALSLQALTFHIISCHKLFGVQNLFSGLKENCKLVVDKGDNGLTPGERKLFQYYIRAIPTIGIKDGGFRILQSDSTLLFINFYIDNVISLLLL